MLSKLLQIPYESLFDFLGPVQGFLLQASATLATKHILDNPKYDIYLGFPMLSQICYWSFTSLYTILYIRYSTVYPYIIVHCDWPKPVENVSLLHLSLLFINVILYIMNNIMMVWYLATFLCDAPYSLNVILFWFFNNFSVKFEVLKILFS